MNTATCHLVRTELKLMIREPLTLIFVFVFPVVTMLIIGGSFGTKPSGAFDGLNPSGRACHPERLCRSPLGSGVLRASTPPEQSRWGIPLCESIPTQVPGDNLIGFSKVRGASAISSSRSR